MEKEDSWRLCVRVEDSPYMPAIVDDASAGYCTRCQSAVWVAAHQELPPGTEDAKPLCMKCALADGEIAEAVIRNLPEVFREWVTTGKISAFRSEDDDTGKQGSA